MPNNKSDKILVYFAALLYICLIQLQEPHLLRGNNINLPFLLMCPNRKADSPLVGRIIYGKGFYYPTTRMLTAKQERQLIRLAEQEATRQKLIRGDEQETAFIVFIRICRDYLDNSLYPCVIGADREKWLINRLNKYKIKYYEKI